MTIIITVLKSGGEYFPEHVQRLHAQFGGCAAFCLSDVDVPGVQTLVLRYDWPGWFSKMALFDPALTDDDILYFDLDSIITGCLERYMIDDRFRMLSDFYHPDKPASGMMFIPHHAKEAIWSSWVNEPDRWMKMYRGDQDVLEQICGRGVARFDDTVKSYKVHVAGPGMPGFHPRKSQGNGYVPGDTHVLCFHGTPRPWDERLSRFQLIKQN